MSTKMKTSLVILIMLAAWIAAFDLAAAEAAGGELLQENPTVLESFIEDVDDWVSYLWQQVIAVAMNLDAKGFPSWMITMNN